MANSTTSFTHDDSIAGKVIRASISDCRVFNYCYTDCKRGGAMEDCGNVLGKNSADGRLYIYVLVEYYRSGKLLFDVRIFNFHPILNDWKQRFKVAEIDSGDTTDPEHSDSEPEVYYWTGQTTAASFDFEGKLAAFCLGPLPTNSSDAFEARSAFVIWNVSENKSNRFYGSMKNEEKISVLVDSIGFSRYHKCWLAVGKGRASEGSVCGKVYKIVLGENETFELELLINFECNAARSDAVRVCFGPDFCALLQERKLKICHYGRDNYYESWNVYGDEYDTVLDDGYSFEYLGDGDGMVSIDSKTFIFPTQVRMGHGEWDLTSMTKLSWMGSSYYEASSVQNRFLPMNAVRQPEYDDDDDVIFQVNGNTKLGNDSHEITLRDYRLTPECLCLYMMDDVRSYDNESNFDAELIGFILEVPLVPEPLAMLAAKKVAVSCRKDLKYLNVEEIIEKLNISVGMAKKYFN